MRVCILAFGVFLASIGPCGAPNRNAASRGDESSKPDQSNEAEKPVEAEQSQADRRVQQRREMEKYTSKLAEEELADWKPESECPTKLHESLLDNALDPAGRWVNNCVHDAGNTLTLVRTAEGEYEVIFRTSGGLLSWQLSRTATYRDGVLTLNRPVQEYAPWIYQRLYPARIDGNQYLIPSHGVPEVHKEALPFAHGFAETTAAHCYAYRRSDPVKEGARPD